MASTTHSDRPLRIAFLGTRGVPARYGGFETAVAEVGRRLAARGHSITVYCRTGNSGLVADHQTYDGMHLVHLPAIRSRQFETLSHTILSALHVLKSPRFDAIILCNSANAPALPILRLRRVPTAIHVDGLEWRRTKWGTVGRQYYRNAESLAVRWADALIADAYGIEQYYRDEFQATSEGIAYGAPTGVGRGLDRLCELGLTNDGYHLIVARFEPENHVDLVMRGYLESEAQLPLVIVGSTPYPGEHQDEIARLAAQSAKVRLVGGLWDQDLLDCLYAGARTYLHGHSVGGTNPSLLRAMGAGAPTIAYDVIFNREVAGPAGTYVATPSEVADAIRAAECDPIANRARGDALVGRAKERYSWDEVASQYLDLCRVLAAGVSQRGKFSGRRTNSPLWANGGTPTLAPENRRGTVGTSRVGDLASAPAESAPAPGLRVAEIGRAASRTRRLSWNSKTMIKADDRGHGALIPHGPTELP